ncbi:MAG: class I SAM-dependent methyltransferase [bacterium]|nr:class I SAM-dependent methyltransferase [bacterium]
MNVNYFQVGVIYKNILRQGPGQKSETEKAFNLLDGLPQSPQILDIGCGTGAQTLNLADLTTGNIIAVDNHKSFLDILNRKNKTTISTLLADMSDLPFDPDSFDLIWSEGAIYLMGFEKGLSKWKSLVKSGGYIAVTEISWLKDTSIIPKEIYKFWKEAYPAIQSIKKNVCVIEKSGYELIDHFTLSKKAWQTYYTPMEAEINVLQNKYQTSTDIVNQLELEKTEIRLYEKYSDYYGYVFYIMKKI